MSLKFNQEVFEKFGLKKLNDKKDLIAFINEEIRSRVAKTVAEKVDVLELRDKVLRCVRHVTGNENIHKLGGTCMDMCPEKERYQREFLKQYKSYEMRYDEASDAMQVDHRLMIKEYSRSAADKDLSLENELRSSQSLLRAIQHILKAIVSQAQQKADADGTGWVTDWFSFIWDRTRSIRKDITQQGLNDKASVQIHEICARFHIYCSHRFCDQDSFAVYNKDQLKNCLTSLDEFYDDSTVEPSQNEAEFRSYKILNHLDDDKVLANALRYKPHVRNSSHVKYALKLFFAYKSRNYVKFFRIVSSQSFSYLAACLTHQWFVKMRIEALKAISSSYKQASEASRQKSTMICQYPLDKLIGILGFDSDADATFFCEQLNVDVISDINETEKYALFPQNFKYAKLEKAIIDRLMQRQSRTLVESKFQPAREHLSDIIYGARLPNVDTNDLQQQSFDANGYYIATDLLNVDADLLTQRRARTPPPSTSTATVVPFIPRPPQQQIQPVQPQRGPPKNLFESIVGSRQQEPVNRNLFSSIVTQPPRQQETASNQQPANLFSRYVVQNESPSSTVAAVHAPLAPAPQQASPAKFSFIENIYTYLIDECTRNFAGNYLNESKWRLSYIFQTVFEETIHQSTEQCAQSEIFKEQAARQLTDEVVHKTVHRMIQHMMQDEVNEFKSSHQNKIEFYSSQIFDTLCTDITSSQLVLILAELKCEYLESLYINVYFKEIFPVHLNEILNEFIYEDTQFCLNVNTDLTSDLNLSVDYALVKLMFNKWAIKTKKQQQQQQQKKQLNRIELAKGYFFKFVRCESYLLHLCWMPINYQHLINNLSLNHVNSQLLYKLMFILPKLSNLESDTESIKRWLLSKFFQFDRKSFTYVTQYSYNLLNSFLQQFGVKFCIKAYFSSDDRDEKITKRVYYGTTGVIFVLMPPAGTTEQQYLDENRTRLRQIVRLVNENLSEDEVIANLRFFVISYLNDEQTQYVINFMLKTEADFKRNSVTYCLVDSKVVRDNQIIEENFAAYLSSSYLQTPKECSHLTILSFFDIFEMTILKFFDYIVKKNVNMPFNVIIEEYSLRLDFLIREFLARDEYKRLTWPIPEHTDFTNAWMAKYWNTKEIIDNTLYEVGSLLALNTTTTIHNSISTRDYKRAKVDILGYLRQIHDEKASNLNECESLYQIESKITDILRELESSKREIKWQKLILVIVKFILTNGFVNFRTKQIHFDQFTIYCNVNKLKSYDWINCGENRLVNYESSVSQNPSTIDELDDEPHLLLNYSDHDETEGEPLEDDDDECGENDDEPSDYQMNRRNYFNKATNKKLNEQFDDKIKSFMQILSDEKAKMSKILDKTKEQQEETKAATTQPQSVNRLDSLLSSLNEESDYNKKLNAKLENLLK